jgi:hypothetical protein
MPVELIEFKVQTTGAAGAAAGTAGAAGAAGAAEVAGGAPGAPGTAIAQAPAAIFTSCTLNPEPAPAPAPLQLYSSVPLPHLHFCTSAHLHRSDSLCTTTAHHLHI